MDSFDLDEGRDECRRSVLENKSHPGFLSMLTNAHIDEQLDTDLKTENSTPASSWKLCTLKCGLTIISSLCLLAFLVYNIVSNIIDKVEFWESLNKYQEIRSYNNINRPDNLLLYNITFILKQILKEVKREP